MLALSAGAKHVWRSTRAVACEIREGLADLLYTPRCAVCKRIGCAYLCDRCVAAFEPIPTPVCAVCGSSELAPTAEFALIRPERRLCKDCLGGAEYAFDWARAAGRFEGTLRDAIHTLKYDGRKGMGTLLGDWARRSGGSLLVPPRSPDIVAPVPLHWRRMRRRGFNQSWEIAIGLVGDRAWRMEATLLKRVRNTRPQVELDAEMRAANVAGAFAVASPELVQGRRVLIVDDVITTLHTVNECARVLKAAGAAEVYAAAVAR